MIRQEVFKEKFREAKLLLGSVIKTEAGDAIYDRLYRFYTNDDFTQAIEDVVEHNEKLIYPVIKRNCDKYRDKRLELLRRQEKEKEKRETAKYESTAGMKSVKDIVADLERLMLSETQKTTRQRYIRCNSVIIREDASRENCYIDPKQEGFEDAIRVEHELRDGHIVRKAMIDTSKIKIVRPSL